MLVGDHLAPPERDACPAWVGPASALAVAGSAPFVVERHENGLNLPHCKQGQARSGGRKSPRADQIQRRATYREGKASANCSGRIFYRCDLSRLENASTDWHSRPRRAKYQKFPLFFKGYGAVEKTRTSTAFRPQRPQRCASTSSATTAHHDGPGRPAPGRSGRLAKLFRRCKRASPLLLFARAKAQTCALLPMSPKRPRRVTHLSSLWRQTVIESP